MILNASAENGSSSAARRACGFSVTGSMPCIAGTSAGDGRSIDLVITVRPEAAKAEFPAIEADVRSALAELGR